LTPAGGPFHILSHFLKLFGLGHANQAVQCVKKKVPAADVMQVASINSSIMVSVTRVNISMSFKVIPNNYCV
jgi:hypothetical protein